MSEPTQPNPSPPDSILPESRRRPASWVIPTIVGVVVIIIVVAVAFSLGGVSSSSKSQVTITSFGYGYNSADLCSTFSATVLPALPDTVPAGSSLNLSWYQACSTNTTTTYTISSVSMETSGFSVVASSVPVEVSYSHYTWLNVTVATPSSGFSGQVFLSVGAYVD